MDEFTAIVVGFLVLLVGAIVLLGILYPGSGAEQLGWSSPRTHAERDGAREADDLAQMLEAANRRRRARGERELTIGDLRASELRRDE